MYYWSPEEQRRLEKEIIPWIESQPRDKADRITASTWRNAIAQFNEKLPENRHRTTESVKNRIKSIMRWQKPPGNRTKPVTEGKLDAEFIQEWDPVDQDELESGLLPWIQKHVESRRSYQDLIWDAAELCWNKDKPEGKHRSRKDLMNKVTEILASGDQRMRDLLASSIAQATNVQEATGGLSSNLPALPQDLDWDGMLQSQESAQLENQAPESLQAELLTGFAQNVPLYSAGDEYQPQAELGDEIDRITLPPALAQDMQSNFPGEIHQPYSGMDSILQSGDEYQPQAEIGDEIDRIILPPAVAKDMQSNFPGDIGMDGNLQSGEEYQPLAEIGDEIDRITLPPAIAQDLQSSFPGDIGMDGNIQSRQPEAEIGDEIDRITLPPAVAQDLQSSFPGDIGMDGNLQSIQPEAEIGDEIDRITLPPAIARDMQSNFPGDIGMDGNLQSGDEYQPQAEVGDEINEVTQSLPSAFAQDTQLNFPGDIEMDGNLQSGAEYQPQAEMGDEIDRVTQSLPSAFAQDMQSTGFPADIHQLFSGIDGNLQSGEEPQAELGDEIDRVTQSLPPAFAQDTQLNFSGDVQQPWSGMDGDFQYEPPLPYSSPKQVTQDNPFPSLTPEQRQINDNFLNASQSESNHFSGLGNYDLPSEVGGTFHDSIAQAVDEWGLPLDMMDTLEDFDSSGSFQHGYQQ